MDCEAGQGDRLMDRATLGGSAEGTKEQPPYGKNPSRAAGPHPASCLASRLQLPWLVSRSRSCPKDGQAQPGRGAQQGGAEKAPMGAGGNQPMQRAWRRQGKGGTGK